jgi:hypothetical protein
MSALRKSIFSASSSATSGMTTYDLDLGGGSKILRAIVDEELLKEHDTHWAGYTKALGKIREKHAEDVVEVSYDNELTRAAAAAELRRLDAVNSGIHASSSAGMLAAHTAARPNSAPINEVPVEVNELMEQLRIVYGRALESGEFNGKAIYEEMGRKAAEFIERMRSASRRANDAIIAGQRNRI